MTTSSKYNQILIIKQVLNNSISIKRINLNITDKIILCTNLLDQVYGLLNKTSLSKSSNFNENFKHVVHTVK